MTKKLKGNSMFEQLIVKKATQEELPILHQILVDCGYYMYTHLGLNHWHPYASLDQFKEKVKEATVYSVYYNNQMIATFNLSTSPRNYYQPSHWRHNDVMPVYLGNLAIHPDFQGKKIGIWCMQQVEDIADTMKSTAIRFDCVQKHPWLCQFYEKVGYTRGSLIPMPEPTGNLVCFEKKVPVVSKSG